MCDFSLKHYTAEWKLFNFTGIWFVLQNFLFKDSKPISNLDQKIPLISNKNYAALKPMSVNFEFFLQLRIKELEEIVEHLVMEKVREKQLFICNFTIFATIDIT